MARSDLGLLRPRNTLLSSCTQETDPVDNHIGTVVQKSKGGKSAAIHAVFLSCSQKRWFLVKCWVVVLSVVISIHIGTLWSNSLNLLDVTNELDPLFQNSTFTASFTRENTNHENSNVLLASEFPSHCHGKDALVTTLLQAGVENATSFCQELPLTRTLINLYGAKPVFLRQGCRPSTANPLQQQEPLEPRVAGLYNTGTNLLVKLLQLNFPSVGERKDRRRNGTATTYFDWDVPHGKHLHVKYRDQGVLNPGQSSPPSPNNGSYLAVVIAKDPYLWMHSMCRNNYGVKWPKNEKHCPNLVPHPNLDPPAAWRQKSAVAVTVKATVKKQLYVDRYKSLLDFYLEWYQAYAQDDGSTHSKNTTPHIIVRYEDLLWRAPVVLEEIAKCAGIDWSHELAQNQGRVRFHTTKAKHHGAGQTGLVDALVRYRQYPRYATHNMTEKDLERAMTTLSRYPTLLQALQYPLAPPLDANE